MGGDFCVGGRSLCDLRLSNGQMGLLGVYEQGVVEISAFCSISCNSVSSLSTQRRAGLRQGLQLGKAEIRQVCRLSPTSLIGIDRKVRLARENARSLERTREKYPVMFLCEDSIASKYIIQRVQLCYSLGNCLTSRRLNGTSSHSTLRESVTKTLFSAPPASEGGMGISGGAVSDVE